MLKLPCPHCGCPNQIIRFEPGDEVYDIINDRIKKVSMVWFNNDLYELDDGITRNFSEVREVTYKDRGGFLMKDRWVNEMKVIYIAGPYNGTNHLDTKQHILNASKVAIECWRRGWAVICPHKNTGGYEAFEDENINWKTWMEGDLEILKRCDAVVMVKDWEESKGAKMELEKAKEWGKKIYYSIDDVPVCEKYSKVKSERADFIF